MDRGIGIIFLLFGLAALIGAVCLIRSNLRKQRGWRKTTGVIIGYQESRRDNQTYHLPQVRFTDDSGGQHVCISSVGFSKRSHQIGDSLAILYNPAAPKEAAVNSFANLYAAGIIITLLAAGFLGLGIGLIFN